MNDTIATAYSRRDADELLSLGVKLRNEGDSRLAEIALIAAGSLNQNAWQPKYELGILHQSERNLRLALAYYMSAFQLNPRISRVIQNISVCSAHLDQGTTAYDVWEKSEPIEFDCLSTVAISRAYVDFVREHPIDFVQEVYRTVAASRGGVIADQAVFESIQQAIAGKKPFALVRLGDGEGSWLHHDTLEETKYWPLYERNRQEFWNIWFGDDRRGSKSEFFKVARGIADGLQKADVIGIPPLSWVTHEYATASIRGCSGTINATRVALAKTGESTRFCSQLIHFDLERKGYIKRLTEGRRRVGVISCHSELEKAVKARLGIDEVLFIKVAGEPSRKHLLGDNAVSGVHFPDRYEEVLDIIRSSDFEGVPFLVAGGILGKSYALELKAAGAVAIDIGSTADKWMGKKTRPNF